MGGVNYILKTTQNGKSFIPSIKEVKRAKKNYHKKRIEDKEKQIEQINYFLQHNHQGSLETIQIKWQV